MDIKNPFAPKEIYGCETLWRGFGNYIARLEQYQRSLKYYDRAVEKNPDDMKTLIDRSKARSKACQYKGALEDLKKVLSTEGDNLIGLAQKSETTFLNCEFEDALVQNFRLLPIRKKPDDFFLGIMKCSSTIEQCLGESAGKPMRDHFIIIRKLAWKRVLDAGRDTGPIPRNKKIVKKKTRTRKSTKKLGDQVEEHLRLRDTLDSQQSLKYVIPPLNQPFQFSPLQRYTKNIENFMAEKYLDAMYLEKIFCKKMKQGTPGMCIANEAGNERLKKIAKETYSYIANKQELLRIRRPFYFIKYQEARISGTLKSRQYAELLLHQQNYRKEAMKILTKLEEACDNKDLNAVLELADKLRLYCDAKPKRLLPEKDEYLQQSLIYIRKAFYYLNRLNKEQSKWDQEKRILVSMGQPISRKPSGDSVINQYDLGVFDIKQQLEFFEKRLVTAEAPLEICWCYHELARFQMLNKRYEEARVYCKNGILEAQDHEDQVQWLFNLHMLMTRICIRYQNKNDALLSLQNCMNVADQIKDKDLKSYIRRCTEIVNDIELDDDTGEKVIQKRQMKILALMANDKIKEEFSHLFRTMAAQPSSRRMNLMAGVQMKGKRTDQSSVSDSIVRTRSRRGSDFPSMSETTKGANFMSLVQYHLP
ncbi:outer dynein arm-docking complex subunit 4-like [Diorhabda carinulata]|uniref:outer dynein arm-docking complex subunit 4-like n=1 Tax=Diorhabda carinulata TaxID=1163345 RepID=UPI0025A0531E|nr:outer dynein arm-docking complex subunit 4-like [Diorhabda carinulata]